MNRKRSLWLTALPIPFLMVLIVIIHFTVDASVSFDPEWLILTGNTVFITVLCVVVAVIAVRNYLATGRVLMMLLGCGVLVFGVGALLAAAARNLADGANLNVTIYNTAALIAALLHFVAAFLIVAGISPDTDARHRGRSAAVACGGSILAVFLVAAAAFAGLTPAFHIRGVLGFTPLRQAVLGAADVLFGCSCLIFLGTYFRSRERFLYWYACALALTAISLTAFFIQSSVGSAIGWTGRISQYLGGLYFVLSLAAAWRAASSRGTSLDEILTESLAGAEADILRAVMESIPEGLTIADLPDSRIRMVSRYGEKLLGGEQAGRTAEQVASQWKVFARDGVTPMATADLPLVRAAASGETVRDAEILQMNANGQRLRLLCNAAPIRNAGGATIGSVVAWSDITERKRIEEALRENEEKYRTLFMNLTEEVHFWRLVRDRDGRITTWRLVDANPAALKTWNAGLQDVKDRTADEIFGPGSTDRSMPVVQKIMAEGVPYSYEDYFPRMDRHFRFTSIPLGDYFITTGADITLLRKINDELEQRVRERTTELEERTKQLRALALELTQAENRERKQLATVLHDGLQQLLVGAKLGMQTVQKRCTGEEQVESLQKVADLLDQSLRLSRALTVDLAPPILYEGGLLAGVKWLARWMQETHGLSVSVTGDAPPIPKGSEAISTLVFQSVREILFNVLKHAGVKEARVSFQRAGGSLQTTVTDHGAGFDIAKVEDHGWETGFGLCSIRERFSLLGGHMDIESAAGSGTRVVLLVPLPETGSETIAPAAASLGQPTRTAGEPAHTGHRRIRVLVADDHRIVREGFIARIQSEADMEVVGEASDGCEALEKARLLRPDVIIMDMSMPRMNGVDATRRIREEIPATGIIGLSMYEKADAEEAMRKAGALAYLTKDGPLADLIAAIRGAVARH